MNIIIVEKSINQELYRRTDGFIDLTIRHYRMIRTDRVEDVITMNELDFGEDDDLYKKFMVRYNDIDKGTIYILCFGDFRIFSKLLLTGGELNS